MTYEEYVTPFQVGQDITVPGAFRSVVQLERLDESDPLLPGGSSTSSLSASGQVDDNTSPATCVVC